MHQNPWFCDKPSDNSGWVNFVYYLAKYGRDKTFGQGLGNVFLKLQPDVIQNNLTTL